MKIFLINVVQGRVPDLGHHRVAEGVDQGLGHTQDQGLDLVQGPRRVVGWKGQGLEAPLLQVSCKYIYKSLLDVM